MTTSAKWATNVRNGLRQRLARILDFSNACSTDQVSPGPEKSRILRRRSAADSEVISQNRGAVLPSEARDDAWVASNHFWRSLTSRAPNRSEARLASTTAPPRYPSRGTVLNPGRRRVTKVTYPALRVSAILECMDRIRLRACMLGEAAKFYKALAWLRSPSRVSACNPGQP
jgi:hypothetical protein